MSSDSNVSYVLQKHFGVILISRILHQSMDVARQEFPIREE